MENKKYYVAFSDTEAVLISPEDKKTYQDKGYKIQGCPSEEEAEQFQKNRQKKIDKTKFYVVYTPSCSEKYFTGRKGLAKYQQTGKYLIRGFVSQKKARAFFNSLQKPLKEKKKGKKPLIDKIRAFDVFAFYDSEFNSSDYHDDMVEEVVSVGLVITDRKGNILKEYYSPISLRSSKKLNRRCKRITGLTDDDIALAPSFPEVSKELNDIINEFQVQKIMTFGPNDRIQFKKTAKLYTKTPEEKNVASKFLDIEEVVRPEPIQRWSLGLADMKSLCGFGDTISHNPLEDAEDLAHITLYILKHGMPKKKAKALMLEKIEERNKKEKDTEAVSESEAAE